MTLKDWVLTIPPNTVIGYDGENEVYTLSIETDLSDEWDCYLDFEYSDKTKGTLPLFHESGAVSAVIKSAYLKAGYTSIQIRAVSGSKIKKSNICTVLIKRSVNATEELTATPIEWEVYEKRIAQLANQAASSATSAEQSKASAEQSAQSASEDKEATNEYLTLAGEQADIATEAAKRASQSVGQVSWAYFAVDENGRLQMNRAESYKEPNFSITQDGRMEVQYGED